MFKKIILFLILTVSIVWLAYVGLDIMSDDNKYHPEQLFAKADGELLIVLRPIETKIAAIESFDSKINGELYAKINKESFDRAYISENRPHALLIRNDGWNLQKIDELLGTSTTSKNELTFDGYQIRFLKKHLYLWKGDLDYEANNGDFKYDKNASAAIVRFKDENEIGSYTDVYFKDGGLINFITKDKAIKAGKKVDDQELFSGYISRAISSYHFYERDYYSDVDSVFAKGPMFLWMNNGFVEVKYKGEKVIISDFIDGQDPLLVLQDFSQVFDTNRFEVPLTNSYPAKGSYTVRQLEDIVVISTKGTTCDQFIADYKLGNTIALFEAKSKEVYGLLPRNVSERSISSDGQVSRSVYQGKVMETHAGKIEIENQAETSSTINMASGFQVEDFVVLKGKGNVVLLGSGGEIAGFSNGKQMWKSSFEGEPIGKLEQIDLHANGEEYTLINTKDRIYLWNSKGEQATGFPIKLDDDAVNEVKFYRWKGRSYFLIATADHVIHYNAKGGELNMIRANILITEKINVWASQRRLFAGFRNDKDFVMYDMDKQRIHRSFEIGAKATPVKIPNELIHFTIQENRLVRIGQKAERTPYGSYANGKILGVNTRSKNPIIIIRSDNELHFLNIDGLPFAQIRIPFNEIADVDIHINDLGKTSIAVLDGLENNVYLYSADGNALLEQSLEGQEKVHLQTVRGEKQITTIVDDFVIQYFEN